MDTWLSRYLLQDFLLAGGSFSPDPTLIGPRNHRRQASDGPSELSVPRFHNSLEVMLRTSDPNVCDPYNVWPRTACGLVNFVGSGLVHKPVSEEAVEGGKAVLPGDFFSFFVGPTVIGDGNLEYSASDLGYFHRDFRLKAKAIRLDLDFLQYISSEGLVADLHVGEVQIG